MITTLIYPKFKTGASVDVISQTLDCPKNGFLRFAGREDEKKAASVSREGHLPLGSFDPLVGTATRARTKLRRREGEEQAKQKK